MIGAVYIVVFDSYLQITLLLGPILYSQSGSVAHTQEQKNDHPEAGPGGRAADLDMISQAHTPVPRYWVGSVRTSV